MLSSDVRRIVQSLPSLSWTAVGSIASWFQRVPLCKPPALWCGTFRRFDFLQVFPKSSLMRKIAPNTKSKFCELEVLNVTGIRIRLPIISGSALISSHQGHICVFSTNSPLVPQSKNQALSPIFKMLKYLPRDSSKNTPNSFPFGACVSLQVSPPSLDSMYILLDTSLCEPGIKFSACPP